jgi:hypothetical protein
MARTFSGIPTRVYAPLHLHVDGQGAHVHAIDGLDDGHPPRAPAEHHPVAHLGAVLAPLLPPGEDQHLLWAADEQELLGEGDEHQQPHRRAQRRER